MAEKFGNYRWVKNGFLDNRVAGLVIGRMTFAGIGNVDFCLQGDCKGELAGQVFQFENSQFVDEEYALERLADFDSPQLGEVSLISLDPHPLLEPHPYIEWFSPRHNHYRIELAAGDGWVLSDEAARNVDDLSESIRLRCGSLYHSPPSTKKDQVGEDQEWI